MAEAAAAAVATKVEGKAACWAVATVDESVALVALVAVTEEVEATAAGLQGAWAVGMVGLRVV